MELLMPAGSLEKLEYALLYGADAVYAGVPFFSLRARENEFNFEDLKKGIEFAHQRNRKVYLTANIFARNLKLKPFTEALPKWMELNADAMIMSDPGLISMVKEKYPEMPIHLSVQANCMNWQSVKFWQSIGVSRIILSRELRVSEIKEIKDKVPDMELEAFVHGSICIAYSGRCLLSHYMSYRDANQGVCDNSCRYGYNVHAYDPEKVKNQTEYYLEDLRDPGQFYQIDEDENGTYIMNAKDLCLLENLAELKEAGVISFKVEGRTKSVHYAAHVAKIYRQAIDDLQDGKPFNVQLLDEINKVANRGYHKGFLMGQPSHEAQNYKHSTSREFTQKFAGLVVGESEPNQVKVSVRNKIRVGDLVEIIGPKNNHHGKVTKIVTSKNENTDAAHGGAGEYLLSLDCDMMKIEPHSLISLL
ncbi:MAG: U32 family peptidase C-terminal domain-containing protein [Bdellovibrionaceae bacterium]|nr:U32 family peptidase C-terminal domain-containing protein [Pseudobdellovibrionaceae bacterium]NUM59173.1 U32 family peptidase C-terminal domain-containing protein [Pseudobdellovibrionaceae bacterium]